LIKGGKATEAADLANKQLAAAGESQFRQSAARRPMLYEIPDSRLNPGPVRNSPPTIKHELAQGSTTLPSPPWSSSSSTTARHTGISNGFPQTSYCLM
jgi:hypothetical protein